MIIILLTRKLSQHVRLSGNRFLLAGLSTRLVLTTTKENKVFDSIYDRIEAGGSVYEDIADMDMDEMMDYFGDLDPTSFL